MKKGKRIVILILIGLALGGIGAFARRTIQEEKELYKLRSFYSETIEKQVKAEEENAINKRKIEVLNEKINEKEKTIKELNKEKENLQKQVADLKKKTTKTTTKTAVSTSGSAKGGSSYRLTSFWPGEGNPCVGASGLCARNFKLNSKGWYTYKGKLVVATATPYLLKYGWKKVDGIVYHKYYDEIKLVINGKTYDAIVLDSCGACMKKDIIDLYVKDGAHSITTQITVKQ